MMARRGPYYQVHTFETKLADQTIQVISKPGMPNWDDASPAQQLLADAVAPMAWEHALLLGCSHGALGVAMARQQAGGRVLLLDSSWIALLMAEQTLHANGATNARVGRYVSVLPEQAEAFDLALITAPPDRGLTRRWLCEAAGALRPGGQLLIAGANNYGIRSAIADAEALFGHAQVLAYRHGNRVALARKGPEDGVAAWASEKGIAPGTWQEFELSVRGQRLRLRSLPGVFAHDRLDAGTALLLDVLTIPAGARVLDLGCGYGIIGMVAAGLGAAQVDLVDANILAVACASENITRSGIVNARAFASDGVPEEAVERYDVIATNPPFHVGKEVAYDVAHAFVEHARRALRRGGRFYLVANQFIRYDQVLRAAFMRVECVAETKSYRVWNAS